MNNRKFVFITCLINKEAYKECVHYINSLLIPDGYEVEFISIEEEENTYTAYNRAMAESDGKYNIYIEENTLIVNKNFLFDVLEIFSENDNIGMIGLKGTNKINPFKEINYEYGNIYKVDKQGIAYEGGKDFIENYKEVKLIDDSIIVTQHNLPWREEIFKSNTYYGPSQSSEFILKGYKVVVANQYKPWIIKNKKEILENNNKEVFIDEYGKELLPLVSILIPTYNRKEYFKEALESAINQTYPNIEIIICDDSTNNETKELVKDYLNKYNNIKYIKNDKNLGQFDNDLKLFNLSKGEYINYLMDDDLFRYNKIEKMMEVFIEDSNEEISLVTSRRDIIDDKGNSMEVFISPMEIENKVLNGKFIIKKVIRNNWNFIGEPTTVLFRKNKLTEPFGYFGGRKYICNVDQASWYNLLLNGDFYILGDVLSSFRRHDNQQLQSEKMAIGGIEDYLYSAFNSMENGIVSNISEYNDIIKNCMRIMDKMEQIGYAPKEFISECRTKISKQLEIAKEKLPLVSVLIPTYNRPEYFKLALESVLNQTYPNIEIIIGDDSTNMETKELIKPYLKKYNNIKYYFNDVLNNYNGPKGEEGFENITKLLRLVKGEYINLLMDDDLFVEDKIEKMVNIYLEHPNIALVTSYRKLINENNEFMEDGGFNNTIVDKDSILSGDIVGKLLLSSYNFIGEPTTALVKRSLITDGYGIFLNKRYLFTIDVAQWLKCCLKGDVFYFREPLSYFRIHSGQNQRKTTVIVGCLLDKYRYTLDTYEKGYFIDYEEALSIFNNWINEVNLFIKNNNLKLRDIEELNNAICTIESKFNIKKCNICNSYVDKFLPYKDGKEQENLLKYNLIGSDIKNFSCPRCYSTDRTRHLYMYLNKVGLINKIKGNKILHIAPEAHLYDIISRKEPELYICGDLIPETAQVPSERVDITNIEYDDGIFDIIICNHVLEHVFEDGKALSEFYRVLKKGGFAIFQTPYSPVIDKSLEDLSINTEELRLIHYGQEDHVRIYGLDLFDRLNEAGFKLDIKKNQDLFSMDECRKFGVNHREDLILVTK